MSIWLWVLIGVVVLFMVLVLVVGWIASKFDGNMGIESRRDEHGNIILLDTPAMRESAALAYDGSIEMEKRGHIKSNGQSWNEVWLRTIASVRKNTENPEWYVRYIIEKRREAGLPELEGLDEPNEPK
ncbi:MULTISPECIES: hypothetical protein [Paenibacillus]|uniref:Uncharacterized protein n=2 Tax=Paenibacillus lactis TaxID=228574 RepID=G4HKX5_9BACL|nr:hypothetical protein [Paenibacillus lactis]EHB57429.1 hypothetical protein PaelaDRAFT_4636 [Paenibacillus lactis 154]MBP1893889.1 hypothetical protein [Paenibacillus lactis]GIO90012.1 hypothetical protein J31TS3_12390 [Paenibacillus lactis]